MLLKPGEEEKSKALKMYECLINKNKAAESFIKKYTSHFNIEEVKNLLTQVEKDIEDLGQRITSNNPDFIKINSIYLPDLEKNIVKLFDILENLVRDGIVKFQNELRKSEHELIGINGKYQSQKENSIKNIYKIIFIGSLVVPALMTFLFARSGPFSYAFFCIPIISQIISIYLVFGVLTGASYVVAEVQVIGWSIIIYIILSIIYYFVSKSMLERKRLNSISPALNTIEEKKQHLRNCRSLLNELEDNKK